MFVLKKQQQGAVLIMVLLLLMVMTLLGVSGVGNSVLEEKMSANYMQNYSAEQSAEFGARVAGWWLTNNVTDLDDLSSWFRVGGEGLRGLYSLRSGMPADAVCQDKCAFNPRDSKQWCTGVEDDCPLHKGFVTLGTDDLGTGELPATDASPDDLQPRFIVEYIGLTDRSRAATGTGGADGYSSSPNSGELHVFNITAIGWGNVSSTRNVIQRSYYLSL